MRLGVTMGDPNGVGPEILLRAFADRDVPASIVVIGDAKVLEYCNEVLGLGVQLVSSSVGAEAPPTDGGALTVGVETPPTDRHARGVSTCRAAERVLRALDIGLLSRDQVHIGEVSEDAGRAALAYVEKATRMALDADIDAIVTLPVNKEAVRLSHPGFSGHTGFVAELCGAARHTMMLASPKLLVTHISTHVSLREAVEGLDAKRVHDVIALTHEAVRRLGRPSRIAVLGLNPHAGEGGSFGREEIDHIAPAVERARDEGIEAVGPLPPDTVFAKAVAGDYGAVVCMYHDQGHIPMKLVAFDEAVNVTLGLPIVRTSVDHGTAYDIAWKGVASTTSFVNALRMAEELGGARRVSGSESGVRS